MELSWLTRILLCTIYIILKIRIYSVSVEDLETNRRKDLGTTDRWPTNTKPGDLTVRGLKPKPTVPEQVSGSSSSICRAFTLTGSAKSCVIVVDINCNSGIVSCDEKN